MEVRFSSQKKQKQKNVTHVHQIKFKYCIYVKGFERNNWIEKLIHKYNLWKVQGHIYNPVEHVRWKLFAKIINS